MVTSLPAISRRICCTPASTPLSSPCGWGHKSLEPTAIYLDADMAIKERTLARTTPLNATPGRYRPPEDLEAFLDQL